MDNENPYAAPAAEAPLTPLLVIRYRVASNGIRFGNYLLDQIVIQCVLFAIGFVGGILGLIHQDSFNGWRGWILNLSVTIPFYIVFEGAIGMTPGKMLTGTKVVTLDDRKISWSQAIRRTLLRLIPFEAFSIFGSGLWHDRLAETKVVKTRGQDVILPDFEPVIGFPGHRPPGPKRPPSPHSPPVNPESAPEADGR